MYDAYARLTDRPETVGWPVRMAVLLGVVGFLIMGIAGPDAYGDGRWAFAGAYVLVTVIYAGSTVATARDGVSDSWVGLPYHLGAAALLVLAALLPAQQREYAWVLAVVVVVVGALTVRNRPSSPLRADHLAERHHLLIMIILAALVLAVAAGAVGRIDDPVVLVAMVCAVALVTTLWWIYFGGDEAVGSQAEAETAVLTSARQLIVTHSLTHLLHVTGLVLLMAGLRAMVADPLSHLTTRLAVTMAVGVAVFCLGEAVYERRLRLGSGAALVATALVVLPTALTGALVSGLSQLALLLGVLLVHIGLRRVARNPGGVEI
jgi:low temperature requirement protein LtrA